MLIAIDYDETFTLDPGFWREVIALAEGRGHSCICATMRHPHEEIPSEHARLFERVVYTGRKAKRPAVDKAGYYPSIWVDDMPWTVDRESIYQTYQWDGLAHWGEVKITPPQPKKKEARYQWLMRAGHTYYVTNGRFRDAGEAQIAGAIPVRPIEETREEYEVSE